MQIRAWRLASAVVLALILTVGATAQPSLQKLGPQLFAYISDNVRSCNSTVLIGQHGILVVDTGLNRVEGGKLLHAIRSVSSLPVQFIINTHYHMDHQGGNGVVGPDAIVISSPFTREQTVSLMARMQERENKSRQLPSEQPAFKPATETFEQELTIFLDDNRVEVISAGPAHTMGDVYVYFPAQRTIATGDLYLTNSSPAMDQGSASNWIHDLDSMLALQADHFVPGHFELGNRATISRFRDYMADLYAQVKRLHSSGADAAAIRKKIDMKKYSNFRQFPQFRATFADNAETIYRQLQSAPKRAQP
ncbi:MAG: MBL fold metallo-hydrolase [Candidatus Acidiferrales bacterium]